MLSFRETWPMIAQRGSFRSINPALYRQHTQIQSVNLAASPGTATTAATFVTNAIILGILAGAYVSAAAAATVIHKNPLEMFLVSISLQSGGRAIVGPTEGLASVVFGPNGDLFPQLAIALEGTQTINYTLTNLTSTALTVSIAHHTVSPFTAQ